MNAQTTAKQTSKMSQIGKTRYMVQVAMLGAAAVVLMFFDIPLPFAPSFYKICLLYTSPSPRDRTRSRMPSSA